MFIHRFENIQRPGRRLIRGVRHPPSGMKLFKSMNTFKRSSWLPAWQTDVTKHCPWKSTTEVCEARRWTPILSRPDGYRGLKLHIVRVVSYNILAPSNIRYGKYEHTLKTSVVWEHRKDRLLEEFSYLNADILCLQEVEAQTGIFKIVGDQYDYSFAQKREGKNDGQATFWRKDTFELLE